MLPYVEQFELYKRFKRDEPWDSPTNKALLSQMPKLYMSPGRSKDGDMTTYYRVFATRRIKDPLQSIAETMFVMPDAGGGQPVRRTFNSITDGSSNTIMIADAEEGVPWTKPDELIYDPKKPVPKLSFFYGVSLVALGDGSTELKKTISEKTLRNAITINDGQILGDDW